MLHLRVSHASQLDAYLVLKKFSRIRLKDADTDTTPYTQCGLLNGLSQTRSTEMNAGIALIVRHSLTSV